MRRRRSLPVAAGIALVGVLGTSVLASCSGGATSRPDLLVADVRATSLDEQVALAALEGIANRTSPRVYLEGMTHSQDYSVDPSADLWLRDAVRLPATRVAPDALFSRLRSDVHGMVVWDPDHLYATQDVATTLAGARDLLPVSPQLARRLEAAPYHFRVVADLRQDHLDSDAVAVAWELAHVHPPGGFAFPAWLGGPRNGNPDQPGLRDWIVARRGLAFDADPASESGVVAVVLSHFPRGTPVYGYPFFDTVQYKQTGIAVNEPIAVTQISRAGDWLVPTLDATNLSLHALQDATPPDPHWNPSARPVDPAEVYVCFVLSDGDNLGYDTTLLRTLHWSDLEHSTIPMGVTVSPWLWKDAPRLAAWYVNHLPAKVSLVAGPSGAGYTYPSDLPDLGEYLRLTRSMMSVAGLHAVWILDSGYLDSPPATIVDRYVSDVSPDAVFTDYTSFRGGFVAPNPPAVALDHGVPVVHDVWAQSESEIVTDLTYSVARQRSGAGPQPIFILVGLDTWTVGPREAAAALAQMGAGYSAVAPDTFVGLLRSAAAAGYTGSAG